jgi:hypothetical protein
MIIAPFLCFPAYVIAQITAMIRFRSGWRWASFVPVLPMIFVVAGTIKGFAQQNNLWPLPLLFASPAALAYILTLILLHRLLRSGS